MQNVNNNNKNNKDQLLNNNIDLRLVSFLVYVHLESGLCWGWSGDLWKGINCTPLS